MKKLIATLLTILMLFAVFQGTSRENSAKAKVNDQSLWSMFHYNIQHTGQCPYDTSNNNGTFKWKYGANSAIYSSPAIGSDGTIYVGSYDDYLYAINPDGTLKWRYGTGGLVFSSPAISSDGTIYVGSQDDYLYAINPDGTLKWKYGTGGYIKSSPAINSNGTIYVGSEDGYLYKISGPQYTITASAGPNGSISPSGNVIVNAGSNKTFTITPDTNYHIADVTVDGTSVMDSLVDNGDGSYSYTFTNVNANHTIKATFAISTYTITASAGPNGSISPSGNVIVNAGSNKTFTIKANPGYSIYAIIVDNAPIYLNNITIYSYTFNNITSDHIISAKFIKILNRIRPIFKVSTINGINLDDTHVEIINSETFVFTISTSYKSNIARTVVKVNGKIQTNKNGLESTITTYLREGVNTVEVTIYNTAGNYATKSFKIISDTKPPSVKVKLPKMIFSPNITIKGTAIDITTGIQSITINGKPVVSTLNGKFKTKLKLSPGTNIITITAIDKAGNKFFKSYRVTYMAQYKQKKSFVIELKIGNPFIKINGISKKIDTQGSKPIIKDGRTLLPIRVLIESLGGTIKWNAKERKVTITLNGRSIILWIGKKTAVVNGNKVQLDVAPIIINGRTYLPLRFISENLGASVYWDPNNKTVTIYYWQ